MAKRNYYDITPLLEAAPTASYYLLFGSRANGKSWQVKNLLLTAAYNGLDENKDKFVYLRRWDIDIKQNDVTSYFGDMPIKQITKGDYEGVIAWQGYIYFYNHDENDKVIKSAPIGRYLALNNSEHYKSQTFVGYKYIVFEEFITDKMYLGSEYRPEPTILQQMISTIARHEKVQTFLIGNTISRVFPYMECWNLQFMKRMELGTIQINHYYAEGSDEPIDIAVEYCKNVQFENKLFFGQTAKQIVSGEWETYEAAKLPRPKDEYVNAYSICVEYQSFKFVVELLVDPVTAGCICFVYPHTKRRKFPRVISDKFNDNPNITPYFDLKIRPEELMNDCFKKNKVCYSDNLTASDFRQVNNQFRFGQLY